MLNWVIVGTNAHAKNHSLLIGPQEIRLAPLYDLLSALPYPHDIPYRKAKLAMRVDREYLAWKIRPRHWEGLVARCRLDPGGLLTRVQEVVSAVPEAARRTAERLRAEGLREGAVTELEERVVGARRGVFAGAGGLSRSKAPCSRTSGSPQHRRRTARSSAKAVRADSELAFLPVVMLNARASRESRLSALEGGADDYLVKPFDPEELQLRIRHLLSARQRLADRFREEGRTLP